MQLPLAPNFEKFLQDKGFLDARLIKKSYEEIFPLKSLGIEQLLDTFDEERRIQFIANMSNPIILRIIRYAVTLDDALIGIYKTIAQGDNVEYQEFFGKIPGYVNSPDAISNIMLQFVHRSESRLDPHISIPFP